MIVLDLDTMLLLTSIQCEIPTTYTTEFIHNKTNSISIIYSTHEKKSGNQTTKDLTDAKINYKSTVTMTSCSINIYIQCVSDDFS